MTGLAAGQLFGGWASDLVGRRPILLGGGALYVLAAIVCGFAPGIEVLLGGRVVQGIGGASALVVARAVIGDLAKDGDAAQQLATMGLITLLAPTFAPLVGGLLVGFGGWRFLFFVLGATGLVALLGLARGLPESHVPAHRSKSGPFAAVPVLLRNRSYLRYAFANATGTIGMFAYLSGASFLLVDRYRLTVELTGIAFLMVAASVLAGTLFARWVERKRGRGMVFGSTAFAAGGVSMLLLALFFDHPAVLVLPMMVCGLGAGMLGPSTLAGALNAEPLYRGSASSLFGALQMVFGAVTTALIAAVSHPTNMAVAIPVCASGLLLLPLALARAR
jgi:DHA1 family bicyclomycin/chloramphenicol resistance-like MFS transporter